MGLNNSCAYKLEKENVIKNLVSGGLVDVLGYRNGADTQQSISEALDQNWYYKGSRANKENISVLCTAATSGQGKTELCRQLVFESETFASELSLSLMIPVAISFNQHTTFMRKELDKVPTHAIAWRILYAFGNSLQSCQSWSGTLHELTSQIRRANSSNGSKELTSIGVFFLVDEVLKIREVSEEFFKDLIDELTNLQQLELREGYPTFLLITSLELMPVSQQVVNKSGRNLRLIPMPFLRDLDLSEISDKLYGEMEAILALNLSPSTGEQRQFKAQLKLLIRIMVSISGRHFRCLEEALKALYKRLVSTDLHEAALEQKELHLPVLCKPNTKVAKQPYTAMKTGNPIEDIDISVKEIFDHVVNQIVLGQVNRNHYRRALELFLLLMNEPDLTVKESEWYDLEEYKIMFIKSRGTSDAMDRIVPRVNLPFLFQYPQADRDEHYEVYSATGVPNRPSDRKYMRLREPAALKLHVEGLLSNIGAALALPFRQLQTTFEDIMIFVEMLTVAARCCAHVAVRNVLPLPNLIPEVIFKPWSNETLCVSSFVLQNEFRVSCNASERISTNSAAETPLTSVQLSVEWALNSNCDAVYITQGSVNMMKIEHISRLFSVNGQQVLCFCSMKLREKLDVVKLARDLHLFIDRDVRNNTSLAAKSYYAMIYCCNSKEQIAYDDLPNGTIVVGFDSVEKSLYPFGLNKLLLVAEEKSFA